MNNVFISVTKEERHKVLVSDRGSCVVSVAFLHGMTLPHTRSCLCLLIKHFYCATIYTWGQVSEHVVLISTYFRATHIHWQGRVEGRPYPRRRRMTPSLADYSEAVY